MQAASSCLTRNLPPVSSNPSGPRPFVGLMSGTSLDAVDGVLAIFEDDRPESPVQTLAFASTEIPTRLRQALFDLQQPGPDELARCWWAANELADLYASTVATLRERAPGDIPPIIAIGAHGQTIRHRPGEGYTAQLLNGARLAESCGLDVVCDFRSADVAAGGQGAPLVPAFHARVFAHPREVRAIVNIGGIANVSLIPAGGHRVLGHDTGPGNVLMDAWCERHRGQRFDARGAWAASGRIDERLLARLLEEPYFGQTAPKSTGRDLFCLTWLERVLETSPSPADVQATLAELTAITIARDCIAAGVGRISLCGGGAFNDHLVQRIRANSPGILVDTTMEWGIDPQAVESLAFAWLARQRVMGWTGNLPAVTGARGPRILGALYQAYRSV